MHTLKFQSLTWIGQSIDGVFLYLKVDDIDAVIEKANNLGSKILLEKTDADTCFVAEITDSEGNRICLTTKHQGQ